MKTAGLGLDKKNKCFTLISEYCEYWHLNNKSDRKFNEKSYFRKGGFLPLRFNNFSIAMKEHSNNLLKALEMCEMFFIRDGKAVYLPDQLAENHGLDPNAKNFTYGRIFREWNTLKLT